MKREVMFAFILIFLLAFISFIYADEQTQVEKAYNCVEIRTNTSAKCIPLLFSERVFTALATKNCENEVWQDNKTTSTTMCWPNSACTTKSTAQAILALNEDFDTSKGEAWILQQTAIPSSTMQWFLEIESPKATSCWINYSTSSQISNNKVFIAEDKKISTKAGDYMILSSNKYWLEISPTIYNNPINITCNESFISTLLFKKQGSSTYHISGIVHSAAANGKTREEVDSLCFKQTSNGACDYEASLWSSLVLRSLGYNIDRFMPYLITMMDEPANELYIPESFLYALTGEFRTDLLVKQNPSSYWEISGNKYYDTALAMLPLYSDQPYEWQNSKTWLLENQQSSGCWHTGSLIDTSFILYSVWPKFSPDIIDPDTDPECVIDSHCSEYECQTNSCEDGVCQYYDLNCKDDDECCPVGCSFEEDNDCTGEFECSSNTDCEDLYSPETNEYCSNDKTKVYKNTSTYKCKNSFCEETNVEVEVIETCSEGEQCYSGSCLSIENPPEECVGDDECDTISGEVCIEGYCILPDCVDSNYFCTLEESCDGEVLYNYYCSGFSSYCCDTEPVYGNCEDEGGEICSYDESCFDGTTIDAGDITYDEVCCLGGTCEKEESSDLCEDNNGACKTSCDSDEKESFDYTCDFDESCCLPEDKKPSYAWVWVLLVLILLSAAGILFRDKLRIQILKLKEKFGKKKERRPFEMPLTGSPLPIQRDLQRRILPSQQHQQVPRPSPTMQRPQVPQGAKKPEPPKQKNELDDVLKKLKEMGK